MPGGRGGRGGGQPGAAAPAAPAPAARPAPISAARLARLKRYDLDWQAALLRIPTANLTEAAAADLTALKVAISMNLQQLEVENGEIEQLAPVMPFAPRLVALIEAHPWRRHQRAGRGAHADRRDNGSSA